MKKAPNSMRDGRTSRFAALAVAGMLSLSGLAMAGDQGVWVPSDNVAPNPAATSTPLEQAAATSTAAAPAAAAMDAELAELATPPPRTKEEMAADADRQMLQSAWIHLQFVKSRLSAAKNNAGTYAAEYDAAKAQQDGLKATVDEKTAAVNAMREDVEAQMAAVAEKYDDKISEKEEEEFDLQAKLGEVGPLEYLPAREADRQNRIAMIKAKQLAVRDDIHVLRDQKQQEIIKIRANLDAARQELRDAETAYAASYHRESTARYKVFQANKDLETYSAALPDAEARLAAAKKMYAKHGDPDAVLNATQMPSISAANNDLDDGQTIATMETMVANAESRRLEREQAGQVEEDMTGMNPRGTPGNRDRNVFATPFAIAVPVVAIVLLAL